LLPNSRQTGVPLPAGSIPAPRDLLRKEMVTMIDAKVSFMNQMEMTILVR
jgi:hypothetical protein